MKVSEKHTSRQQIHTIGEIVGRHKRGILVVVMLFLVVFEITYAGNIGYGIKWLSCGQRPVLYEKWNASLFGVQPVSIRITHNPGFFAEKTLFFNGSYRLFCNVEEAENAARETPYSVINRNY